MLEHKQVEEEIQARARAQKYEFESRMQDEMIANMELKANQKLLAQLRTKQQEEDLRQTRDEFNRLQEEANRMEKQMKQDWQAQRRAQLEEMETIKH